VDEGRRVVATSGGHCLEGFVSDPDVSVIVDMSPMKRIYHDAARRAIAVEAGATVGETFRALFEAWGVVVPLGESPQVGMGGHVPGGAFGFLCRQLGLAADYLYAVEVVTVDAAGRAKSTIATREPADSQRELWWAHTGGGGGNFGVVTRFWFRSPDASADDPSQLLPRAPGSITTFRTESQIRVAYEYLTRDDHDAMGGMLGLATYGGRINVVPPDATSSAHRSSILDIACTAGWLDPAEDAANLRWVRSFYRDLFSETGGVPVPCEAYDGALINHPDTDLADPRWNTSGVPWSTVYYNANYAPQRIKARWDPKNIFQHALSVRA
jgi:FAD/FMN-containing dehydrogenase